MTRKKQNKEKKKKKKKKKGGKKKKKKKKKNHGTSRSRIKQNKQKLLLWKTASKIAKRNFFFSHIAAIFLCLEKGRVFEDELDERKCAAHLCGVRADVFPLFRRPAFSFWRGGAVC
jgi:hypothetical protein